MLLMLVYRLGRWPNIRLTSRVCGECCISDSRTLAAGFHYETYGEISLSRTLSYAIRFTDQFDFTVSDKYSYKKINTASLGMA